MRPFQVNPPSQWLNTPGGAARIDWIMRGDDAVIVGGPNSRLLFETPIASFAARRFDEGDIVELLGQGMVVSDPPRACEDPSGRASGFVGFDFDLAPGESMTTAVRVEIPYAARHVERPYEAKGVDATAGARAAARWEGLLNAVRFDLPRVRCLCGTRRGRCWDTS